MNRSTGSGFERSYAARTSERSESAIATCSACVGIGGDSVRPFAHAEASRRRAAGANLEIIISILSEGGVLRVRGRARGDGRVQLQCKGERSKKSGTFNDCLATSIGGGVCGRYRRAHPRSLPHPASVLCILPDL